MLKFQETPLNSNVAENQCFDQQNKNDISVVTLFKIKQMCRIRLKSFYYIF